jgi:hypothetical protein
MGLALLAGWLGAAAPAWAQAPIPEPLPCGPASDGTAMPVPGGAPLGPLSPQQAPPGPCSDLVLPASIPGAFTDNPPDPETGCYFNLGGLMLQRGRMNHGPVAVIDRLNPTNLDNGQPILSPFKVTEVENLHDVHPGLGGGIEGTWGYMWGGNALELTGYYIFDEGNSTIVNRPGRLDSFFFNPPLGFEGDNGLWLQADQIRTTLHTALGNAEFNYRWSNEGVVSAEGIVGFRYTDLNERLSIFTDDDGLTIHDINGFPDPTRQAVYRVLAHNHLVAGQLGFEAHANLLHWVSLSLMGKGAWGENFVDTHFALERGDGLVGRSVTRYDTTFSMVYEFGAYLDFWLIERVRLRAGYQFTWLVDFVPAGDQVNFNLATQGQGKINTNDIYYHGPMVELQLLF